MPRKSEQHQWIRRVDFIIIPPKHAWKWQKLDFDFFSPNHRQYARMPPGKPSVEVPSVLCLCSSYKSWGAGVGGKVISLWEVTVSQTSRACIHGLDLKVSYSSPDDSPNDCRLRVGVVYSLQIRDMPQNYWSNENISDSFTSKQSPSTLMKFCTRLSRLENAFRQSPSGIAVS